MLTNYGLTESSSIVASETLKNFNTGSAGKPYLITILKSKRKLMKNMGKS